ncbi:MAG: hypothetical protein K9W44_08715 [Candidatus Lokiarchaeota archaeon]|nr:hypothetical protein [Candidatus Harpocratesius repetitus]
MVMFFLLDTCALNHIRELYNYKIIDLRHVLKFFRICITQDVLSEWVYYNLDHFFPPTNCYIFPVEDKELEQMIQNFPFFEDFDIADQTLLLSLIQESSVLISDDGALNAAALSINKKAIFLPDFCIFLVNEGFFSKKDVRRAIKFWEKVHRFRLSDLKRWTRTLNQIM